MKPTETEITEELKGQQGTSNGQDNNDFLTKVLSEDFELKEVDGSPLMIMRHGIVWTVVLGKYILSEKMNSEEEAVKDAKRTDLFRIMDIITAIIDIQK